jgi:SAM-dependent methyltransferase
VFDQAYYRRFYEAGGQSVRTQRTVNPQARAVFALMESWGLQPRSALEAGAGPGFWKKWMARFAPHTRVKSIDISLYACRRYGHELRDLSRWAPARPYDLVICQDVLQYLTDAEATRAIRNLGKSTREILFLEVPTREDIDGVIDDSATDLDIHLRPAAWYRVRLSKYFDQVGAGLWLRRGGRTVLYALEANHRIPRK